MEGERGRQKWIAAVGHGEEGAKGEQERIGEN